MKNPEWEKNFKLMEPIADQLILAGWMTGYAKSDDGFLCEWTDYGRLRIRQVAEIINDIKLRNLRDECLSHVILLLFQEAIRQGVWDGFPPSSAL